MLAIINPHLISMTKWKGVQIIFKMNELSEDLLKINQ